MTLSEIIRRFGRGVAFAIVLVLIEKLAWIIEPTVFGHLLDRLIDAAQSKTHATYSLALFAWIGVFAVNSGVGAWRRSAGERIYQNMFINVAVSVAETSQEQGLDVAAAAARTELSREYITFLQRRVPDIIEQFFDLGGTVIALSFFDWRISLTCLAVAVPLMYINRLYTNRVTRYHKDVHDRKERLFDVFQKRDLRGIREYYEGLARPQIRIARWGAFNFFALRVFLLFIFLAVLYIAIDLDNLTTGKTYSVVAYLWTFITSTEYIPDLLESATSLREIQARVQREALAFDEASSAKPKVG
jgi:ABC-type multidrug transport system fused ATPase/permease subunit